MTLRGVLLFAALLCSALPSSVEAASAQIAPVARQTGQRVTAGLFGVPLPAGRDPQAWQAWRQQVRAQLGGRRAARLQPNGAQPNDAGGTATGIIETIAGAAPFQKPVNALKTGFGWGLGLVEDSAGNLYVASCDLGVVLKVDPFSNTTVYAGQPLPIGPATSTGDGGPATSARLPCPSGLAMDAANNLYITDNEIGTVRVVDGATGVIQTIAGKPGQFGHSGDGGPATAALLEYPTGIALDGQGNLFIEDLYYVWRLNLGSGIIQTFAGTGDVVTTNCKASASVTCAALQTNFYFLGSTIAVRNGYLYAAPEFIFNASGGLSSSIVRIGLSSGTMQLLAGGGAQAGTSTAYPAIGLQLDVQGMAVDSAGNVFIAGNSQTPGSGPTPKISDFIYSVDELLASDYTLYVIAGNGDHNGYSGNGGLATMAGMGGPEAICLSPEGEVVFVDDRRIRSFPIGGNIATIAGDGPANDFGDGGIATQAGLDHPQSVASDPQGNLYIADTANRVVRKIDAVHGMITTIAGGGNLYGAVAEGAPALQVILVPFDVALDSSNHLYIRDQYNGLKVVDLTTGTIKTLVATTSMAGPMVFDGDKTLYYASQFRGNDGPNNEVWAVDVTTGATTVIAGGSDNLPSGDGGPAIQAGLYDVQGLALDGRGHLYLADNGFGDIRVIDLASGIISTIAGIHPNNPYIVGYSGDGGPAASATFNYLAGLAYDGAGHLAVIDSRNHVLRQIDLTTNIITTIVGNHTPGFGGDGASASAAMLYFPYAAIYDSAGNLIIADGGNDRVRRVVLHPTKLNAVLGYGGGHSPSGDNITFTAAYSGLAFGIAPTGTVTFSDGATSLGSGTVAPATDGSGSYVATVTSTSQLAIGDTITAQYSGDANYAALTSTLTFTPVTPSYTITANPAALTIKQGSSGSITFSVTPINGFNQAVSFSCDSTTVPQGVTCSFTPASVTPNGTSAVTTTLTVQTMGVTTAALHRRARPFSDWLPRGGAVLALLLLGIPRVRRWSWLGNAALVVFAVCFGGVLGCGGGGSNSGGAGTQNANATPPGSYSIRVTSVAGSTSGVPPLAVSLTVTE